MSTEDADSMTVSTALSDEMNVSNASASSSSGYKKGKLSLEINPELNSSFDSESLYWDGVINNNNNNNNNNNSNSAQLGHVYNPMIRGPGAANDGGPSYNNSIGNIDLNYLGIGNFRVNLNDLVIFDKIGEGSCSSVHLAVHKKEGIKYAVKTFNVNDLHQTEQLKKEIYILATIPKHSALISFEGIFQDADKGTVGIILEYMDRGSLLHLMEKTRTSRGGSGALTEQLVAALLYQLLSGLQALHTSKKIHRDVKPGNILLNSQGFVKLTDFGVAKDDDGQETKSTNSTMGTYKYMSPERLLGHKYSEKSDMWSLGIIVLELCCNSHPFARSIASPLDLLEAYESFDIGGVTNPLVTPYLKLVVSSMLQKIPASRGAADSLLRDEWFVDLDVESIAAARALLADWFIPSDSPTAGGSMIKKRQSFTLESSMSIDPLDDSFVNMTKKNRSEVPSSSSNSNAHNTSSSGVNCGENFCFISCDGALRAFGIRQSQSFHVDPGLPKQYLFSPEFDKLYRADELQSLRQFVQQIERGGYKARVCFPSNVYDAILKKKKNSDRVDVEIIIDGKVKLFRFLMVEVEGLGVGKGPSSVIPDDISSEQSFFFLIKGKGELSLVFESEQLRDLIFAGFEALLSFNINP